LNNTITGNAANNSLMAKQAATLYMVLVATTPLMVAAVLTIFMVGWAMTPISLITAAILSTMP